MPPEPTPAPIRWRANIVRRSGAWHRVELAGAHESQPPIALVKEPQDAVAIAALQDVAGALREARDLLARCTCMAKTLALEEAANALDKMEGRDAAF